MNMLQVATFFLIHILQEGASTQVAGSQQTHLIHLQATGSYQCGSPESVLKAAQVNSVIKTWLTHEYAGHEWQSADKGFYEFVKGDKRWTATGLPEQYKKACEKIDYVATLGSQRLIVEIPGKWPGDYLNFLIQLLGHNHVKDRNGDPQILICGVLAAVLSPDGDVGPFKLCQWKNHVV